MSLFEQPPKQNN